MINVKAALLALLALSGVRTECGVGTLSCLSDNGNARPIVCDFFDFYRLDVQKTKCIRSEVEGCLVGALPNGNSECFLCRTSYVLDAATKRCTSVPSDFRVSNCNVYSGSPPECAQCQPEFFLESGQCLAVTNKIEHCLLYHSTSECSACSDGSFLDANECKGFRALKNCLLYRSLDCDKCENGHLRSHTQSASFDFDPLQSQAFDFADYVRKNLHFEYWVPDFSTAPCSSGPVAHCADYKVDYEPNYSAGPTCTSCALGFYLSAEGTCVQFQAQPIEGCNIYFNNTTCMQCDSSRYYLNNTSGICVEATSVDFCAAYFRSTNECEVCEDTHSIQKIGDTKNSCVLKTSKSKFFEEDAINGNCPSETVVTLNEQKCLPKIQNCQNLLQDAGFGKHHFCVECSEGFRLNSDQSECIQDSLEGCEHAVNENQTICKECEPFKFLMYDGKCEFVSDTDYCFETHSSKNQCTKCKPLYWLDQGKCKATNFRSRNVVDPNCESNAQEEPSSNCDSCADGFTEVIGSMTVVEENFLINSNCARVNPASGKCAQCAPLYKGNGTWCSTQETQSSCVQMKPNYFGNEMATNCSECKLNYYLDKGTCRLRNVQAQQCEIFSPISDSCLVCKEGALPRETPAAKQCQMNNFEKIIGCKAYNSSSGICEICGYEVGYFEPDSACGWSKSFLNYMFDVNLEFINPRGANSEELIENCFRYVQSDFNKIACIACESNFLKVVDLRVERREYVAELLNSRFEMGLAVTKCAKEIKFYSFNNVSNNLDKCDLVHQAVGSIGYACLRCKTGYTAKRLLMFEKDIDESFLSSPIWGFSECKYVPSLARDFGGLHSVFSLEGQVPLSIFMGGTNCDFENSSILFSLALDSNWNVLFKNSIALKDFGVISCIESLQKSSSAQLGELPEITNCQVWGFSSLAALNAKRPDRCLSCAPGTMPLQNNKMITQCNDLKVLGICEEDSFLMNGCSNPKRGYVFDYSLSTISIFTGEDNKISDLNCLIYSLDFRECLACKKGYILEDNICFEPSQNIDCKKFGISPHRMSLRSATNSNLALQTWLIFFVELVGHNANISIGSYGCAECAEGYLPIYNSKNLFCEDAAGATGAVLNCKQYFLFLGDFCAECEEDYLLNFQSNECIAKSKFSNCQLLAKETPNRCAQCSAGYALNALGECENSHCDLVFKGECSLCVVNYMPRGGSSTICDPIASPFAGDSCQAYSPLLNSCGKCKSAKQLYVFPELDSNTADYGMDYSFVLISGNNKIQMAELGHLKSDELEPRLFWNHDFEKKPAAGHCWPMRSVLGCSLENSYLGLGCTQCDNGYMLDPVTRLCKEIDPVKNCKIYSADNNCLLCTDGNFLEGPRSCRLVSSEKKCMFFHPFKDDCQSCEDSSENDPCLSHCLKWKNSISEQICEECVEGYIFNQQTETCMKCREEEYLDQSEESCKSLTAVTNCVKYRSYENQCDYCNSDHYLQGNMCMRVTQGVFQCTIYSSNGVCRECQGGVAPQNNSCTGALPEGCVKLKSEGICEECSSDYYLENFATCRPFSKDLNCKAFNRTQDECTDCFDGFAFDQNKKCVDLNPEEKCKDFSASRECIECKAQYWLDGNICRDRSAEHCQTTVIDKDECALCIGSYYKDTNDSNLCKLQNVPYCFEHTLQENSCAKCTENYFLEGGQCNEVTTLVEDCRLYSSNGVCQQCKAGKILQDNKCEAGSIENCEVYSSANPTNCEQCTHRFFLTTPKQCTERSVSKNCLEYAVNTDECISCSASYYVTEVKSCEPYNLELNCAVFKIDKNECESCPEAFYFDSNLMSCKARSVKFCAQTKHDRDECINCLPRHWLNGSQCVASNIVTFCTEYSAFENACAKCQMDYYLTGGACEPLPTETRVEFCAVHRSPSSCIKCLENYFLESTNKCVPGLVAHCQTFDSQERCNSCRTGFYLATQERCAPYSEDLNCLTFNSFQNKCLTCPPNSSLNSSAKCIADDSDKNCIDFSEDLADCVKCSEGFVLTMDTKKCSARTAQNCKEIHPSRDECTECQENYWRDTRHFNECNAVTPIDFCIQYNTIEDACEKCANDYVLNSNECKKADVAVENCAVHSSSAVCFECNSGYFLDGQKCSQGSIEGCSQYAMPTNCQTCEEGRFRQSANKCTTYSTGLYCKEFDPEADKCTSCANSNYLNDDGKCIARSKSTNCEKIVANKDECTRCEVDFYLQESDASCQPFTAVGCKTRHIYKNECIDCANEFFFDASMQKCTKYTKVENCAEYFETNNLCRFCIEGFYFVTATNLCHRNPDGIENCVEYSDKDMCFACAQGYFLSNNRCNAASESVEHCRVFIDTDTCAECNEGYFLNSDSGCIKIQVPNCVKGYSINSCSHCKSGYILSLQEKNLICTDSGIQGCKVAIGGYYVTCMECEVGRVLAPNQQDCLIPMVPTGNSDQITVPPGFFAPISGCFNYLNSSKCSQCYSNYVRSVNCSNCERIISSDRIDSNCKSQVQLNSMVCDTCHPGYYKNHLDVCVSCGGTGCAFCHNSKCTLCREGFYMNAQGDCLLNSGTETISGGISSLKSVLLMGIFMLFLSLTLAK